MIHKITSIKNLGKFKSPIFGKDNWNGIFKKNNILYANNGSGKTTLSLLFRSLRGNNELLPRKKSFNAESNLEIQIFDSDKKEYNYKKNKWNKFYESIEIYDSFFVEENVYVITVKDNHKGSSIFEIMLGEEAIEFRTKIIDFKNELKKLQNKRTNIRNTKNKTEDENIKKEYEVLMKENSEQKKAMNLNIKKLESDILKLSEKYQLKYLEKINHYLSYFNPSLKLLQIKQFNTKAIYTLEIEGFPINKAKAYSLKYSLSEADKNSLSLSFFFAKLDLKENLNESTIIIDDPITSFDYSRKNSTINIITKLASKAKQIILLTHDQKFAFDLSKKFEKSSLDTEKIKINSNKETSYFQYYDAERENLSGIFKDLTVLNDYILNGAQTEMEKREVIRCIRPCIEGIFRIKFFGIINQNEWLGDIIERIKSADEENDFYRYKNLLDDITEINDYSKEFHHSNPLYFETPINDYELKTYTMNTLKLIKNI